MSSARWRQSREANPEHDPDEVVQALAIPKTLPGNLLEVPVNKLFMGHDSSSAANRDALADPEGLRLVRRLRVRQQLRSGPRADWMHFGAFNCPGSATLPAAPTRMSATIRRWAA